MKSKIIYSIVIMSFVFLLNFVAVPNEVLATSVSEGYDLNKIEQTSQNVSVDSLGVMAREYSIPIVVISVVLSGFMALAGLVFKPLKLAAGGLFGITILFYIMVNYAPEISGIIISVVDSIVSRISGGV
jgi:uncharacterized membrane protein YphA (DoxX/SURF4 family)